MEKLDLLVLGATGFTGNSTVKFLTELSEEPEYQNVTWGIAGRSEKKLQILLKELSELKIKTSSVVIIKCDINNETELRNATGRTKILINCTGPLSILGESVIKSCIETRTHYVDISAELPQIFNAFRNNHNAAEEGNVLIVPSCGLASIPSAAGLMFLQNQFKVISTDIPDVVDCYFRFDIPRRSYAPIGQHCLVHSGTWESLVCVLQDLPKYLNLKKETFPEPLVHEPIELKRSFFHRHSGEVWFPYPGPDEDLIEMSQRYVSDKYEQKPIRFRSFCTVPKFYHFLIIPPMYMYYYLSRFEWFRKMLCKHPKVFTAGYMTRQGPSEVSRMNTKYTLTMTGKSWDSNVKNYEHDPKKSLTVKVSGTDPGYYTTAMCLIISAMTILRESDKMPKGGVLMPAAAFQNTNLVENLMKHKMEFEVVTK
uniref:Saccharopine dehydrogenase NADP binding domain-containing protein n=1 Tax=Bombyx mori TaxID=7091 RepID=A0A8R2LVU1_BOMMO|nr:saccharopine dehydrogenase-like oxidoreductase isoform X6 [Bombyx mori]